MKIDIEKAAQLARLRIEPEKREMFASQTQAGCVVVPKTAE